MSFAAHFPSRCLLAIIFAIGTGLSAARAGDLVIVGSSDGQDILRSIAMAYSSQHPKFQVLVPPGIGSSGAVVAVGLNRNSLGRISRSLNADEVAAGIKIKPLFYLPVAIISHPNLALDGLKGLQVAALFSGNVTNWREFGGPDLRVRIIRQEDGDAAMRALSSAVPALNGIVITDRTRMASENRTVIEIVRSTPGSVAVIPYSASYRGMAKVLALEGLMPWEPGYPVIFPLGLVYRSEQVDEKTHSFLDFASGPQSATIAARFGARVANR